MRRPVAVPVSRVGRGCRRLWSLRGRGQRSDELDEHRPVRELVFRARLDREPRLAGAGWSGQRQELYVCQSLSLRICRSSRVRPTNEVARVSRPGVREPPATVGDLTGWRSSSASWGRIRRSSRRSPRPARARAARPASPSPRGTLRAPRPACPTERGRASAGRAAARAVGAPRPETRARRRELGMAAAREVGVDAFLKRPEAAVEVEVAAFDALTRAARRSACPCSHARRPAYRGRPRARCGLRARGAAPYPST
jgi:hypothetical protein